MAPLYQKSPFIQLLVLIGLFLLFLFSFQLIGLGFILPRFYGITASQFASGEMDNPDFLGIMKGFQLAYSIFAFLLPALVFFLLWHPKGFRFAGLSLKLNGKWLLFGMLILLVSLPGVGYLSDLNHLIHFGSLEEQFRDMEDKAEKLTLAMLDMPDVRSLLSNLFLIAIIPAIAEECFFRGAVQRLLVKMVPAAWFGILLASVFFSLVHGEMFGFIPRVALGMILGLIYYYSGNLWYAIFVHFINNGFQVVLVFLYQHHYINIDITQDSPTPVLLGLASIFLVTGLFIFYRKNIPQNPDKVLWSSEVNGKFEETDNL